MCGSHCFTLRGARVNAHARAGCLFFMCLFPRAIPARVYWPAQRPDLGSVRALWPNGISVHPTFACHGMVWNGAAVIRGVDMVAAARALTTVGSRPVYTLAGRIWLPLLRDVCSLALS